METLQTLLTDDAILISDGGGEVAPARKPIKSMPKVSKFLASIAQKNKGNISAELISVNKQPGLKISINGQFQSIWTFSIRGDQIEKIFAVLNPSKLTTNRRN